MPAGWRFGVDDLRVHFRLTDSLLHLGGGWTAAEIANEAGTRVTLSQGEVAISGEKDDWQYTGEFRVAGAATEIRGQLAAGVWNGTLHLLAPDPGGLIEQLGGGEIPPLAGGLEATASFSLGAEAGSLHGQLAGRPGKAPAGFLMDLRPLAADFEVEKDGARLSGSARLKAADRDIGLLHGSQEQWTFELRPLAGNALLSLFPAGNRPALLAGAQEVAGAADLTRDAQGEWQAQVRLKAAVVPMPEGALRQIAVSGLLQQRPNGMTIRQGHLAAHLAGAAWPKGKIAARFAGELTAGHYRLQLQEFSLDELDYASADGLSGFTAGQLKGGGSIAGGPGTTKAQFDLNARLMVGEVLKEAFYADLSALPADLRLRGSFDRGAGSLQIEKMDLDLAGIAAASGAGIFGQPTKTFRLSVSVPALDRVLSGDVGAGLSGAFPIFDDLRLAGAIAVDVTAAVSDHRWHLQGELRPQDLAVHWPTLKIQAQGGSGRIPFALADADASGPGTEPRQGKMTFGLLQVGPAHLAQPAIDIVSAPGSFAVAGPLRFELAEGEMQISEMRAEFIDNRPRLAARLNLSGIDLRALTRELDLPPMEGDLSADLGRIRYADGTVTSDGTLQIGAFGGTTQVRNLRLEALLSGYPNYYADVDFTGIDLSRLTRTFAFGEINGVADGYLHDLRLLGTTPAAFTALFETREKGRRSISVKALRNISVLSEGGFSAVLSRGIYRFIDFYRYRRIGIACALQNDLFTLEGTARPGSDRYLVYGGWLPPKIDIIAPVHTISFKEMVKRLQRIDRTERPAAEGEN